MRPAPPKALEALLGFLIPYAYREHMLGDLHERYIGPWRYVSDAAGTVPRVILSRIRRTTDPQLFLVEASALYFSFLAAAWWLGGSTFLEERSAFLRLAIPAVAAMLALVLGDAYALPDDRLLRTSVREAALGAAFMFVSQAALWAIYPPWVLPSWVLFGGGAASVVLVSVFRMLFPPSGRRPRAAT